MLAAATLLALCLPQGAPEHLEVIGPEPAVVRLTESSVVNLLIYTERRPKPPELPKVDGLLLKLGTPSFREVRGFANGKWSHSRTVSYPLHITPQREGRFTIPAFPVSTGAGTQQTKAIVIEAVRDIKGGEYAFLNVSLNRSRVYVHEPIRITVEFGVDNSFSIPSRTTTHKRKLVEYHEVEVRAHWLSEMDGARNLLEEDPDPDMYLLLNETLQPVRFEKDYRRGGRSYYKFRFEKSFLPTRVGKKDLGAPVLRYAVVRNRRQSEVFHVYGKPLQLEVLPLPEAGRPHDYSGAVGQFKLQAELDRQQVKVGESVKLKLRILGAGNNEFYRVPELEDVPGFHVLGEIEERSSVEVEVIYDLTPKTADVSSVPSIKWNYFDTQEGQEVYKELHSPELPLKVIPLENAEALAMPEGEELAALEPGVDDIFDMKPLRGAASGSNKALPAPWLSALLALCPWALFAFLGFSLRRYRIRRADSTGQRRRSALGRFHKQMAAQAEPLAALLTYLADRLDCAEAAVISPDLDDRLRRCGVAAELADETMRMVESGVSARYGGGGGLHAAQVEAQVGQLEKAAASKVLPALLFFLLLTPGWAQDADLAAQTTQAAREYRAGNYPVAAQIYQELADVGNPRAQYNLGNCFYRQGQFAQALAAYERARLVMPRDPELRANRALVRLKLGVGDAQAESILDTLVKLRDSLTQTESFWLCLLLNVAAAACLFLGGRAWRWFGLVLALPAVLLILEIGHFGPARPPQGVVLQHKVALRAEPNASLSALMKISQGVSLQVLGEGPSWLQVQVADRRGYLPKASVAIIR